MNASKGFNEMIKHKDIVIISLYYIKYRVVNEPYTMKHINNGHLLIRT